MPGCPVSQTLNVFNGLTFSSLQYSIYRVAVKVNENLIALKDSNYGQLVPRDWYISLDLKWTRLGTDIQLKGQCHEIFDFWFFHKSVSPKPLSIYTIRAVSNCFENSRRYSQLKVHHWCCWQGWQMEKIFNHKSFIYFVWTPLESRVNL